MGFSFSGTKQTEKSLSSYSEKLFWLKKTRPNVTTGTPALVCSFTR